MANGPTKTTGVTMDIKKLLIGDTNRRYLERMDRKWTLEDILKRPVHDFDMRVRAWPSKASFLSLPSELRQNILLQTFDAAYPTPISRLKERCLEIGKWFNMLMRVHLGIADDIAYVFNTWANMFEIMVDEQYRQIDQKSERVRQIVLALRTNLLTRRSGESTSEHWDQRQELEERIIHAGFQCRNNHDGDSHKTTFLTLPRELRQQILLDTFDAATPLPNLSSSNLWMRHDEIYRWAVTLRRADMCLHDDVAYVLKQWFKEFGAWHTLEVQKANELYVKIEELSKSILKVPPLPPIGTPLPLANLLGILLFFERSRLLEKVRRIMGQDESD
ncbi:hypothetical protein E2P81_ATG05855 [Venturia nashicola]|uniref:Uncharacterized protein n=1 Tax=Venturia nashicola TaxID=86259 RepID=A0A4Z1PBB2_9PEZI|nr:hypothetical protein E6O75_ATG06002 [Venturia nashicola]TLD29561.1 hypothetical protein E2P81_ATG05855 [Venturia nashicola]